MAFRHIYVVVLSNKHVPSFDPQSLEWKVYIVCPTFSVATDPPDKSDDGEAPGMFYLHDGLLLQYFSSLSAGLFGHYYTCPNGRLSRPIFFMNAY